MLSAPGMVPAAASSGDRTSKSLALPEATSERSSEKETVGTGEEGMKSLEGRGTTRHLWLLHPHPGSSFPAQWCCLRPAATPHSPLSTNSPPQGTSQHRQPHIPGVLRYLQPWFLQPHLCDCDAELQAEASPSPSQSPTRDRNRKQGHGPWSIHTQSPIAPVGDTCNTRTQLKPL